MEQQIAIILDDVRQRWHEVVLELNAYAQGRPDQGDDLAGVLHAAERVSSGYEEAIESLVGPIPTFRSPGGREAWLRATPETLFDVLADALPDPLPTEPEPGFRLPALNPTPDSAVREASQDHLAHLLRVLDRHGVRYHRVTEDLRFVAVGQALVRGDTLVVCRAVVDRPAGYAQIGYEVNPIVPMGADYDDAVEYWVLHAGLVAENGRHDTVHFTAAVLARFDEATVEHARNAWHRVRYPEAQDQSETPEVGGR